jgi:WXG100 family type VII secretion target
MAFTVDLDHLLDLIDQMEQFDRKLTSTCDEIEQTVADLQASWSGDASEQQQQAHALWETGTSDMAEALRQLRSDVGTAHRNYDRAFAAGMAMWNEG